MVVEFATFLQPALQPVFDKLFKLGENQLSTLLVDGEKVVKKWENQLHRIKDWLDDAEEKQFSNKVVKHLLGDVQDVVYDMEDVLDRLAIQADENELDQQQRVLQTVVYGAQNTVILLTDKKIRGKIAKITKRLEDIEKQVTTSQTTVDIKRKTLQTEALRSERESSYIASKMYGRDELKQEIVERLLRMDDDKSNENYVMIPIVGTGGIGKTTLAQHVYNDERLEDHFNLKAWVCVSDVFDIKDITTSIINGEGSNGAFVEFSNLNQAQNRLKHLLMGKKFLIVLDDIWNEKYQNWDSLQLPFQHAAKGSTVIMTTRCSHIAKSMSTNLQQDKIIYLESLSEDACWNIVQHHAKNKTGLAGMRTDIINKCKGLPLAAKVLGGILKIKDTGQCQQILNSDIWNEIADKILPVLRLSYHHLPPKMKHIFAYCSIFPKDYEFKEEFVLLWMAQGFLQGNELESMDIIRQKNLPELVSRSLLEVGRSSNNAFIMRDLIHDLALQVAGDIFHVMDTTDMMKVAKKRARHVSLTANAPTTIGSPPNISSQLRTLYCYNYANVNFIESFSCIRALSLDSDRVEELPEGIGDLKHLRFLKLKCICIGELPKSISKLSNLQTLWLGCSLIKIHGPCPKLPSSLRYLKIRDFHNLESISLPFPNLIAFSIERCPNFKSFDGNALPPQLREVKIIECDNDEIKQNLRSDPDGLIWMDGDRYSLPY